MRALVTGGATGLGKSIVSLFAKNGYDVVIVYNSSANDAKDLQNNIKELYKVNAYTYRCDISNELEVINLIDQVASEIGQINCLINNAGIAIDRNIIDKTGEEFMEVIKTNLLGTFLMSKHIKKVMKNGSIVNVSSNQGIKPSYEESIDYDASKAGINSLTHSFALSYSPNIRVNAVAPGWVNTKMIEAMSEIFKKEETEKILLKRFASPEEVADVVYFLASNTYINDEIIKVDGGLK